MSPEDDDATHNSWDPFHNHTQFKIADFYTDKPDAWGTD